ncbi:hypothetical protein NPIL_207841 [Nephila pilipes]|uniref:Uncharacterized protein n=1 Tax=Nephila pilipes TaxID=299642 RepID=A0A8X6QX44_NEPPI|nr:hypothetical protein NPIL_207841 [Nephila pilipes]
MLCLDFKVRWESIVSVMKNKAFKMGTEETEYGSLYLPVTLKNKGCSRPFSKIPGKVSFISVSEIPSRVRGSTENVFHNWGGCPSNLLELRYLFYHLHKSSYINADLRLSDRIQRALGIYVLKSLLVGDELIFTDRRIIRISFLNFGCAISGHLDTNSSARERLVACATISVKEVDIMDDIVDSF